MEKEATDEQVGVDNLVTQLLPRVEQVMDVAWWKPGTPEDGYQARYEGELKVEAMEAYERLEPHFADAGATLLLRQGDSVHIVLAVEEPPAPEPSRLWIHLAMAAATVATVLFVGFRHGQWFASAFPTSGFLGQPLGLALLYAGTLLGILGAHEFGHYLVGRYHKISVTLPYFIPFPGGILGTMGAVIKIKSPPKNRRHLLDVGLAGPYAGLALAIPALLIGLNLSVVRPLIIPPLSGLTLEGNSIIYLAAKYLVTGELLPSPADLEGSSQILYWLQNVVFGVGGELGVAIPFGGRDVMLHPMAFAAWAGILVTGMNLIPAGQLDGGHSIYAWLGKRVSRFWPFIVVGFVMLVFVWRGWIFFAALVFLMGRNYATPLDEITELDTGRKIAAILALVIFLLTFTPVPLILIPSG